MEDAGIVALYWARNEQAIQETREKYSGYCYGIAVNLLGEHHVHQPQPERIGQPPPMLQHLRIGQQPVQPHSEATAAAPQTGGDQMRHPVGMALQKLESEVRYGGVGIYHGVQI